MESNLNREVSGSLISQVLPAADVGAQVIGTGAAAGALAHKFSPFLGRFLSAPLVGKIAQSRFFERAGTLGLASMGYFFLRAWHRLLSGQSQDRAGDVGQILITVFAGAAICAGSAARRTLLRGGNVSPWIALIQSASLLLGTAIDTADFARLAWLKHRGERSDITYGQLAVQGLLCVAFGYDRQSFEAAARLGGATKALFGRPVTPEGVSFPAVLMTTGGRPRETPWLHMTLSPTMRRVLRETKVSGAEEILKNPILFGAVLCVAGGMPRGWMFRSAEGHWARLRVDASSKYYVEDRFPFDLEDRMTVLARECGVLLGPRLRGENWLTVFREMESGWRRTVRSTEPKEHYHAFMSAFAQAERLVWAGMCVHRTRVKGKEMGPWLEGATAGPELEFGLTRAIDPGTGEPIEGSRTRFVQAMNDFLAGKERGYRLRFIQAKPAKLDPGEAQVMPRIVERFKIKVADRLEDATVTVFQGTGGVGIWVRLGDKLVKQALLRQAPTGETSVFHSPAKVLQNLELCRRFAYEAVAEVTGRPRHLAEELVHSAAERRVRKLCVVKDARGDMYYFEYRDDRKELVGVNSHFEIEGRKVLEHDFEGRCASFQQAVETLRNAVEKNAILIQPNDDFLGVRVERPGRPGDVSFIVKSEAHGNWEVVRKEPMSLKLDETLLYRDVYEFLQQARITGSWDFNPVAMQVHGGLPLRDEVGKVSPAGLVRFLEHWCLVEGDFIGAMAASPHRRIYMRPMDTSFRKLVSEFHSLQRQAGESTGQWIARVVKEITAHTVPKYMSMNVDNYLWALLREAETQQVIQLRERPSEDLNYRAYDIYVLDAADEAVRMWPQAVWSRTQRRIPIPTAEGRWWDVPAVQTEKGWEVDPDSLIGSIEFMSLYAFAAAREMKGASMREIFPPFRSSAHRYLNNDRR